MVRQRGEERVESDRENDAWGCLLQYPALRFEFPPPSSIAANPRTCDSTFSNIFIAMIERLFEYLVFEYLVGGYVHTGH
jgi:hypothetical protein